jgi:hypothetical protein
MAIDPTARVCAGKGVTDEPPPGGLQINNRYLAYLISVNPSATRIKELIELWDRGHHLALREELIRGSDFILMPPSWWPSTPCPRQHGWWMRTVDSITLTRCLGCSGMVQTSSLDPVSKTCPSCRFHAIPPKGARCR